MGRYAASDASRPKTPHWCANDRNTHVEPGTAGTPVVQRKMRLEAEDAAPAVTARTVGTITVANSSATTSVNGSSVASARREPKNLVDAEDGETADHKAVHDVGQNDERVCRQ